jgi:type II secretory pathway component PulF
MPEFQYIALKPGGKKESGVLNAGNRAEALTQLGRKGLRPMKLSEAGDAAMAREMRKVRKGGEDGEAVLNRSELLYFTEDMADLLENGLQLEPALAVLERRQQNSRVKTITNRLRNYVRDGGSFSKALRGASKSFSDLYCNMAEAGEISGTLPHILRRQAAYLHAINELQSKVVSSLMYPVVLVVVGFGLLIIFVTVLIPNLLTLFQKTGASMPFLTRMLFWFSEMVVGYWWLWLAIGLDRFFRILGLYPDLGGDDLVASKPIKNPSPRHRPETAGLYPNDVYPRHPHYQRDPAAQGDRIDEPGQSQYLFSEAISGHSCHGRGGG